MGFTSSRMTRTALPMDQLITARSVGLSAAGVTVDFKSVTGIPAVQAAVEFASEAVAQLRMAVWKDDRFRTRADDSWQSKLFKQRPNPMQDEFEFWHTIQASIEYRSIAFVWKTLGTSGRVIARTALHPGQVNPRPSSGGRILYDVFFLDGYPVPPDVTGFGSLTVGPDTVMAIRGRGSVGELVPLTPIQRHRKALGLSVSKQEYEASLFANGAGHGLLLKFPAGVKKEEADQWRESFDDKHAGPTNAGKTKVVGNGVEVEKITMTQADAQFVESVEMSLRDACLIFHVPDWLLGVGMAKGSKPGTPEHEMQRWRQFYLDPRLSRIESAFNADGDFFGDTGLVCAFDSTDIVRGDLQTEDMIAHQQIQDGRLLVDEWREEHGRPELPNGLGKIPQITPVGGAPNQVTPVVQQNQQTGDDNADA